MTKYSIAKVPTATPGVFALQYRVIQSRVTGHPLRLAWSDFEDVGQWFAAGMKKALDTYLDTHPQYALRNGLLYQQFCPRPRKDKSLERPAYVLACLDYPEYNDRYTVYLGGEFLISPNGVLRTPLNTTVQYLGMNAAPTHPLGISQFGESSWFEYDAYVKTNRDFIVSWDNLPEKVRKHIRSRCE
jgi:hypothetical protein